MASFAVHGAPRGAMPLVRTPPLGSSVLLGRSQPRPSPTPRGLGASRAWRLAASFCISGGSFGLAAAARKSRSTARAPRGVPRDAGRGQPLIAEELSQDSPPATKLAERCSGVEQGRGQYLIGEELVRDEASAAGLAKRCIVEAERLLFGTEGWRDKMVQEGIKVQTCPVTGPFASSGVDLVRGIGELDCSAADFFDFQVSKSGFQATDEYLQNHRLVDGYPWRGNSSTGESRSHCMVNRVEWPYPTKTREFVSLDIVDYESGIFISKSCLHPNRPGGSKYQDEVPLDERDFVRAVQYYGVKAVPISKDRCRLHMVTWGEMCDSYSNWWVNQFNVHLFIVPKFDRFRTCLNLASEGCDVDGYLARECSRDIAQVAWDLLKLQPNAQPEVAPARGGNFSDFVKVTKKRLPKSPGGLQREDKTEPPNESGLARLAWESSKTGPLLGVFGAVALVSGLLGVPAFVLRPFFWE